MAQGLPRQAQYLLGTPGRADTDLSDEDDEDDHDEDDPVEHQAETPSEEERDALRATLQGYLDAISALGRAAREDFIRAAKTVNIDLAEATQPERDTLQEIVEDEIGSRDDFHALVDAIFDDVESRFELLAAGDLVRGRDGWPRIWKTESGDRRSFIRSVNRFSSNYAPSFGRLLTPLVEGIRVAGPFCPAWRSEQPKLVLLDGQGLGHKADSVSSISRTLLAATKSSMRSYSLTTAHSLCKQRRVRPWSRSSPAVTSRS